MVMPYHLHMPSYFLETFTEYPSLKICFDGIMVLMEIIIPSKLFSKENRILVFMRLNRGKQMI